MKLRQLNEKMFTFNDGTRTLVESVVVPEIISAIKDWKGSGVLVGGLALSFYAKPRYTMDIDILFLSDKEIPPQIPGFKRTRDHAFQHNKTHVEVEVLSPSFLHLPPDLIKQVVDTSKDVGGMKIASRSGLVALKLQRNSRQDQADIEQLIQSGDVDLAPYAQWISPQQRQTLRSIAQDINNNNNKV